MLIMNYNYIQFINFEKLDFNFENNFFNFVKFFYKNKQYNFKIYKKIDFFYDVNGVKKTEEHIVIEDVGKMLISAEKNKVFKHADFDFCFLQENQELGTIKFDLETIFKNYKLGILSNV